MRTNSFYPYVAFASVLVYFCYGMSPKNTTMTRISDQEHELIFSMLKFQARSGSYDPCVWRDIKKAHEEKFKAKVKGFPKRRSIKSMQQYFINILKYDKIPVPDALRELYEQMKRTAFSLKEQDFINRELMVSGDDNASLFNEKRWADIQKKFERKHDSGDLEFPYKRSASVLRNHFRNVMIPKGLVHEAVKRKFPRYFEAKEAGTSYRSGPSESGFRHYSDQEHELMFKMLAPHAASYDPSVWKEVENAFEEKRKANATGFATHRSIKSIQQNLINLLKNERIPVPDPVKEVYEQMKRIGITREEQALINRELARSDLPAWPLNAHERWKRIEEKHDEKRKSGAFGFDNKRSEIALRNHFSRVMKAKNLVHEDVKKRFPKDFQSNQGGQSHPEENEESGSNEESEVWGPILDDLERSQHGPIDDYGVDHTMFLDHFDDSGLYMDDSPYDLRTFEPMSP